VIGGPLISDAGALIPAFFSQRVGFDNSKIDWGQIDDYLKMEGIYMYGGKLDSGYTSDSLICFQYRKTRNDTLIFKTVTVQTEGESPPSSSGHGFH
jgi:hypothetical protein